MQVPPPPESVTDLAPEPPEKHDVTFSTARTVTHAQVYGQNLAGEVVGDATGLYNKHRTPDWHPWYPFVNAFDYQQARALSTQTKSWVDDYLRAGLDSFRTTSFHSASELRELLRRLDFGLGDDSWRKVDGQFGTIWCRDILTCAQFLLAHLPFQEDLDFAPVRLYDREDNRIYSEINTGEWWWETQERLPDGATVVPMMFASDKTHLTNFSGDKSAWPIYMTVGNIHKEVRRTSSRRAWILVGFIPVPPKGVKAEESWHRCVHSILRPLRHVDIQGPGMEWDCADGFKRRCYPILAAWIGDYPEMTMITKTVGGSCPVCEVEKGKDMGHPKGSSKHEPRCPARYQEHLETNNDDELHKLHVQASYNHFWEYPLCNVYRLWQPDALHQLYLGIVKTVFNWLLDYLTARGLKEDFDTRFTGVPSYPGLARFTKTFDSLKSGSWQGKEIREMLRSLSVLCAPLLSSDVRGKTQFEKESDIEVMKTIRALSEFCLLTSQRTHSDISLKYLDTALNSFYKCKVVFTRQRATEASRKKVETAYETQAAAKKADFIEKITRSLQAEFYRTTPRQRNVFQARLDTERQRTAVWDLQQKAQVVVQLEEELFGATGASRVVFHRLFNASKERLGSQLGPRSGRGPRSKFAKDLEHERWLIRAIAYGSLRVTDGARQEFEERLLQAEHAALEQSAKDLDEFSRRLELEVYGVDNACQRRFQQAMTVQRLKYDEEWEARKGPSLRKQLETEHFHFGLPKMHLLSHYREFIVQMGSPDNYTTDISERLHITNVKNPYRGSNRVDFLRQILLHNDRHTSIAYMEQTLKWLAMKGWHDADSAAVLNLMSPQDKRQMTRRARHRRILANQPDPSIQPASRPPLRFQGSQICAPSEHFRRMSLAAAAGVLKISNLPSLVEEYLNQLWGREVVSLIWGPDDLFQEALLVTVHNKVASFAMDFHVPEDVNKVRLDCTINNRPSQVAIHKCPAQSIWARVADNDLNEDTFRGRRPTFPLLYFTFTPPLRILEISDWIARVGGKLATHAHFVPSLQSWVKRPSLLELAIGIGTRFQHRSGDPEEVDGFVRVVKLPSPHVIAVESIEGPCHLIPERMGEEGNGSVWIVNNQVDLDTYWDIY
jgi:hypothetical protein